MSKAGKPKRVHHRTHGLAAETTISFKVSKGVAEQLHRDAQRNGISRSELIRYAVDRELQDPMYPYKPYERGIDA